MKENPLWLIFKLKDNFYAINVNYISSISMFEDNLTPMPESEPFIKGITRIHDNLITVMDMREFFNLPNLNVEYDNFKDMIDERKNDHILWVETLFEAVNKNIPFTLTTDPHKCAFGKWRDNFQTELQEIGFQLNKIDKPHYDLHDIANHINQIELEHREDASNLIKDKLNVVKMELMPQVLKYLDETKEIFMSVYKGMLLCLNSSSKKNLGLIVDEVLGVEHIDNISNEEILTDNDTNFISGISTCSKIDGLIMRLNIPKLIEYVSEKI